MSNEFAMTVPAEPPDLPAQMLVTGRECGGCTACCVTLSINQPELRKDARVPCQHLVTGGCGIYESRPRLCRGWLCLWREVALREGARPDKSGVIFSREFRDDGGPFKKSYIRGVACNSTNDFAHPETFEALVWLMIAEHAPIWLNFGPLEEMFYPDEKLARAILDPAGTSDPALRETAERLRLRWEID